MRFKVIRGYVEIPEEFFGRSGSGGGPAGPAGPAGPQGPAGDENSTPLSNTLWIDEGTSVALAEQNGSIGRPYSTVTAAIADLGAEPLQNYILVPGDYSAEADIVLPATASARISFFCLSSLYGIGAASSETNAKMMGFSGGAASQAIHFTNCLFDTQDVNVTGQLRTDWCRFLGATDGAAIGGFGVTMNYCQTTQRITAGPNGFAGRNLVFDIAAGTLISTDSTVISVYFSSFQLGSTVNMTFTGAPGEFRVDSVTNFHWEAVTESIVNGVKVIQGDLT